MIESIRNKKNLYIILIFLLVILALCYLFRVLDVKKYLIPIYKVEDRTSQIKKAEEKYKDEDVVGWIRVQGTNIDYPIVRNYQDMEIRERGFDHVWVNSNIKPLPDYFSIIGHNVRNVSKHPIIGDKNMNRFEQLMSFIYYDFNQDNKYIQVSIGKKNYLYQIFSVAIVPDYKINYRTTSYTKKQKRELIEESMKDSYFKYDIEVSENDKIISLVTCTRFNGFTSDDFKIDAKLVENEKKGYNYSVSESKNYKNIKKILEGDGDDV